VAQIEWAIKERTAAMKRANEQMTSDQSDVDRLKAESRALLARLKPV
jgi:hypothetical protein